MLTHRIVDIYLKVFFLCVSSVSFCASIPTLETERCILREVAVEDALALFPLGSNADVAKYSAAFDPIHQSVDDTVQFIQRRLQHVAQGDVFPWVIIEKTSNKVIGFIHLFGYSAHYRKAEIGYLLLPECWGKGIATETVKAVISFAFNDLRLNRLQAAADPANQASIRIMLKCGMQFEGVLRNYYIIRGKSCDRSMYSLLDSEFFNNKW